MENSKQCTECNETKPLTEYYGNRSVCKQCIINRSKANRAKRPKDELTAWNKLNYSKNKDTIKATQKKYRQSDTHKAYLSNTKDKRNAMSRELRYSKINHHIRAINKALREAHTRDKLRTIERKRHIELMNIVDKYNKPIMHVSKEWKDIEGYEGLYKVSNHGEVYSCIRDKMLSLIVDPVNGYVRVNLYNGDRRTHKVHRLVCMAFIPNIHNKVAVNHIDFNRTNNNINNLEWCTTKENNEHRNAKHLIHRTL